MIQTLHYLLEAFLDGDAYSAAADKRRFYTVDNQIHRIAEIISDGVIDGWEITSDAFPSISVSSGSGLIDTFYVNTYDDKDITLSEDSTYQVYAQRRVGIIGTTGPKSDVAHLTYIDSGPPAMPSNLVLSSPTPFSVLLRWDDNTEEDFSHYRIERSYDGIEFTLIATVTQSSYEDNVEEDSDVYYQIIAVDLSNNVSTAATSYIITSLSTNPPPNPVDVLMPISEAGVNVIWKHPAAISFDKILHYKLSYVKLNTDDTPIEDTRLEVIINKNLMYHRIDELVIQQKYNAILYTIDTKNRQSPGVSINVVPVHSPAPRDPNGIAYSMVQSPGGVEIHMSWTDDDSPYDTATSFRYRVYVQIDGQRESLPIDIPIGFTTASVSLYTFDLLQYFPIPENTIVTLRLTSLDQSGFESFGSYLRFETEIFTATQSVRDLISSFNTDNGTIAIRWRNAEDTYNVQIIVLIDNLNDEYIADTEILNIYLGRAEYYLLQNVLLDAKYTIRVIPYNQDNTAGESSTTVSITRISGGLILPSPPPFIDFKIGDKQITLNWSGSDTPYTKYFKIYRRAGNVTFTFSDWTLIDTLPSTLLRFVDYGLENDQIYSYYIIAEDVYGRKSLHLEDGAFNLNFIQVTPRSQGALTPPDDVSLVLNTSNNVVITWDALLENFDAFSIYRSIQNLHSWEQIATVSKSTFSYTDIELPRIDGTTYYYMVDKSVNDSDIVAQTGLSAPANSLFLGTVRTFDNTVNIDTDDRRVIANLLDPLTEYTNTYILPHLHREITDQDPTRIDLSPELVITDWATVDGRVFTTTESDISGTSYIVRVDNHFPPTLYSIDAVTNRLIFAEPIVDLNPDTGEIVGTIPTIEVRVLGVEEVTSTLNISRFKDIHARQVGFGEIAQEQLPALDHEGRIKETVLPKRFLLERYSDHTFTIPGKNTDATKTFGDGTTFFAFAESDGNIEDVLNWDLDTDGSVSGFRQPAYSSTTASNIILSTNVAEVDSSILFQNNKSYHLRFQFIDSNQYRWVRITTENAPHHPNPVIDLKKRVRFKVLLRSGSVYLTLGIREIDAPQAHVGDNGGASGPIEWVGANDTVKDLLDNNVPVGVLVEASDNWQDVDIDLQRSNVINFENGNSSLSTGYGVLEHIAFTISDTELIDIYITQVQQVNDVIVAGTSNGIQLSSDFGRTWSTVRLTDTPVHKFYKAQNNRYIWAISASQVLLATDPAFWFVARGTAGIQFIRDIAEDNDGDMYISTEKGVYKIDVSLISRFGYFKQTQLIDAFSTDCYGLYHREVSSGLDEIWVSTENGIYKTVDGGDNWINTGMGLSLGFVVFSFNNIGSVAQPNIIGITKKHVLQKYTGDSDFRIISDIEQRHGVSNIWQQSVFDSRIFIITDKGVYSSDIDTSINEHMNDVEFRRVLTELDTNGFAPTTFAISAVDAGIDQQMIIGQENHVLMLKSDMTLSTKIQYDKEIPSFFVNDLETHVGYVFNTFNNVICFREPLAINDIVTASHLPRRIFSALNGGWAQTKPDTDVFIYKNGLATWLDWQIDNASVLGELQIIEGQLNSLPELNTFNSLYPTSQTFLESCLADIHTIRVGGQDSSVLINNDTITKFFEDYTRFLSLISQKLKNSSGLDMPQIILAGLNRDNRRSNRSKLLEDKYAFQAEDATGITIDTTDGTIDFLQAFSTSTSKSRRDLLTFSKYDDLRMSIYNTNIKNTGELTHTEIEDSMEDWNTGLTSQLTRITSANIIKAGIFLERQNHRVFDRYNVRNIQSKFYSAYTNDWYDVVNSTIDYQTLVSVDSLPAARFANTVRFIQAGPYDADLVWVGTDNGIMVYTFDSALHLYNVLQPSSDYSFIWDIYSNEDAIYIIAQNNLRSKIFYTQDSGDNWSEIQTINLPNKIFGITSINKNLVVGTENGPYYSDNDFGTWYPCDVVVSDQVSTDSRTAFKARTSNLYNSSFIIAESERWFFTTGQGIEFFSVGRATNNSLSNINKIARFKNITYIATDRGLYRDGNSILSDMVQFGLETSLESDSEISADIHVNDIAAGSDALYCCASNGKVYRYYDSGTGNVWAQYRVPNFGPIHKIAVLEGSTDHIVATSYDKITLLNVTPGTGIFDA